MFEINWIRNASVLDKAKPEIPGETHPGQRLARLQSSLTDFHLASILTILLVRSASKKRRVEEDRGTQQ